MRQGAHIVAILDQIVGSLRLRHKGLRLAQLRLSRAQILVGRAINSRLIARRGRADGCLRRSQCALIRRQKEKLQLRGGAFERGLRLHAARFERGVVLLKQNVTRMHRRANIHVQLQHPPRHLCANVDFCVGHHVAGVAHRRGQRQGAIAAGAARGCSGSGCSRLRNNGCGRHTCGWGLLHRRGRSAACLRPAPRQQEHERECRGQRPHPMALFVACACIPLQPVHGAAFSLHTVHTVHAVCSLAVDAR